MSTEVAAALVLAETKVCPSVDLSIGSVFGLLGAARLCLVYRAGPRVSRAIILLHAFLSPARMTIFPRGLR